MAATMENGAKAPREIEVKLQAPPDALESVLRDPLLEARRLGAAREERAVTVYYDTPELDLARSGVALRIRRVGRRRLQTVKTRLHAAGRRGGAADRAEWEWTIEGDEPDLALLASDGVAALVPEPARAALRPVFSTEIRRTRLEISAPGSARIEVAMDRGCVRAGEREAPVSELELELLDGGEGKNPGAAPLYHLALELQRGRDLVLSTESKADIGYALLAGKAAAPRKADAIVFPLEAPVGEAFEASVRNCLGHLLDNQAAALAGADPEGIHQMRVAVRRLRSALRFFRKAIDKIERKTLETELRWLAAELGPARDWDVFAGETLCRRKLRDTLGGPAVEAIATVISPFRDAAHAEAKAAIRSPRYTTLVLTLSLLLEEGGWRPKGGRAALSDAPIADRAPELIAPCAAKARKAGKGIARLAPEERHQLRKRLKELRYAVTFLRPLYPGKAAQRYAARLSDLQDVLGDLNDYETARALVPHAAGPGEPRAEALLGALDAASAEALGGLPAAWRRFKRMRPFWTTAYGGYGKAPS
jgi:inorganic triphosphatase YgiF